VAGDLVSSIQHITDAGLWINGGYFAFRKNIFEYLRDGEELVVEPFQRLIAENRLIGYKYDGFWACMDTFKEKQQLEDLYTRGNAPWEVWKPSPEYRPESMHV
jgi:glucose-1-phosphate cytidylyltransferase